MIKIPLEKRLKKNIHKKIAAAQDFIVDAVYTHFPKAVVHGGTSIWRCYNGSRFSEDIDVYIPRSFDKKEIFNNFVDYLKNKGFIIKSFKKTANSIFSKFEFSRAEVRFEAVFKTVGKFVVKPFELTDGTFVNVYTLSPEDLLIEKIAAYQSRKKARDLYDIWFLSHLATVTIDIKRYLKNFEKNLEKPKDYDILKTLIIFGAVPTVKDLMEDVRLWVKKNT